jgi:transcriptional regulator with XRE-family HTH domain
LRDQPLRQRVGALIRGWRRRRRLSQLELSLQANVSARHLSFVESGRSKPSREMILRLAEALGVPLRERNTLLVAGGFAPTYGDAPLDSSELTAVRSALRQLLSAHEPYPAVAIDRHWNLVDANTPITLFTEGVAPDLLEPPMNVLRASLHPGGMAARIVNLGEWRAHLLNRLRRQIDLTADPALVVLYDELRDYPCAQPEPRVEIPGADEIGVVLRVRHAAGELAFFSTHTVFGAPLAVTVAELAIESFFPADAATATALHELFGRPSAARHESPRGP